MPLADTVERVRSGVLQIIFVNAAMERICGGSAFLSNGHLITNHHVFLGHSGAHRVGLRRDNMEAEQYLLLAPDQFAKRLVSGSEERSYDYAILNIPEVVDESGHQFTLQSPAGRRIGESIALIGFPLEHDNLTCHGGMISSFYASGVTNIIQLDASVNAGNSGGPLIDVESGHVIGIVTRKATGLSQIFSQLRLLIGQNIAVAQAEEGGIQIGGVNLVQATIASQHQMLITMDEIERQANVGIGYAFSADHLLEENCLRVED
jgi:S1-C subfamily serine protease